MRAIFVMLSIFCLYANAAVAQTVAMVQYDADRHYGDYQTNMANLTRLATDAVAAGATVVVLPEGSAHGYATSGRLWCRSGMTSYLGRQCDDVTSVAEAVPGGATGELWSDFARTHDVLVFYAIMEKDGDAFFNTLVAVDGQGYVGRYRKRALYWVDEAYADPGVGTLTVSIGGQAFGVMICMDANYAVFYDEYRDLNVTNIIASMDWDQSPAGQRAGRVFFRGQAWRHRMNLFVADQSVWDSTGYYDADGSERGRAPLAPVATGTDGFTLKVIGQ